MKQKALNYKSLFQMKKIRFIILIFILISNMFALLGFFWSISPVEPQISTIQLPDTFSLGNNQQMVQFPVKRTLTVSYPEYIRFGDIQEFNIRIEPQIDPSKCDDFCTEKHLTYENVWLQYQMKLLFSFDLNNLQMEPRGDTLLPLAKSTEQAFSWQVKATAYNPAYIKNTIYLVFDSIESRDAYDELVFAREVTIPVKKAGFFSFPIFRVICAVWLIASILWYLLNKRLFVHRFP